MTAAVEKRKHQRERAAFFGHRKAELPSSEYLLRASRDAADEGRPALCGSLEFFSLISLASLDSFPRWGKHFFRQF